MLLAFAVCLFLAVAGLVAVVAVPYFLTKHDEAVTGAVRKAVRPLTAKEWDEWDELNDNNPLILGSAASYVSGGD